MPRAMDPIKVKPRPRAKKAPLIQVNRRQARKIPKMYQEKPTRKIPRGSMPPQMLTPKGQKSYNPRTNKVAAPKPAKRNTALFGKDVLLKSRVVPGKKPAAKFPSKTTTRTNPSAQKGRDGKGLDLSTVLEQIGRPHAAAAGFAQGVAKSRSRSPLSPVVSGLKGAAKGAKTNRGSFAESLPRGKIGRVLGTAADLVLDPANFVPAGKLAASGAMFAKVGKHEQVAPEVAKAARRMVKKTKKRTELNQPHFRSRRVEDELWLSGTPEGGTPPPLRKGIKGSVGTNLGPAHSYSANNLDVPSLYAGWRPRDKVPNPRRKGTVHVVVPKLDDNPLNMSQRLPTPSVRDKQYGLLLDKHLKSAGIKQGVSGSRQFDLQDQFAEFRALVEAHHNPEDAQKILVAAQEDVVKSGIAQALVSGYGHQRDWSRAGGTFSTSKKGADKLVSQLAILDPSAAEYIRVFGGGAPTRESVERLFRHLQKLRSGE